MLGEADTYTSNYNSWCTAWAQLGTEAAHSHAGAYCLPSPGGWMLKMTRTQERDRGLYSCLASNEAGEVRRNYSVEVLGMSQPVLSP